MRIRLLIQLLFSGALLPVLAVPSLYAQQRTAVSLEDPSLQPKTLSLSAALADGDENWDARFGHPSLTYTASALAVAPNGDLYVGGTFTAIGGIKANNIARWDGQRWHPLGDGIANGNGYVYALTVGPDGALYVGGYFTTVGTKRANSIARWDPATQTWSALGQGLSRSTSTASVYSLVFQGNTLYAGGDFTTSGQAELKKFARWNGTAWEDLGSGLGRQNYDGTFSAEGAYDVRALAVRGTEVFIGGGFDAVAAGRANSLARFDTQDGTFHAVGGGVGSGVGYESAGTVRALAVDAGRVCVGGTFDRVGLLAGTNAPASNVACWDGAAWHTLGDGIYRQFGATVDALAFVGTMLVATGQFDSAGGEQARFVAGWNGTAWSEIGGGLASQGNALAADGAGGFFVTGGFVTVGDNFGALRIAHWTGQQWQAMGQGLAYSTISAHVRSLAVGGGLVYAAGGQTHAGGVPTSHISAWDGQAWHALGDGLGTPYEDAYAAVIGPDGALYVGGNFTTAGTITANRIARWDPATRTWTALGNGVNGSVKALAFAPNGDLYAGGEFTRAGNVEAKHIARWDGQQWATVGGGMNSYVDALTIGADGRVYAGGWFDQAGGNPANRIAIWNGTNWSALGGGLGAGFSNRAYAIALIGDDVYVGGNFDATATTAAAGIARWNQATGWSALGSGIGGGEQDVYAFILRGDDLFVGGNFVTAGDQPVGSIARWNTATQSWTPLGSGVAGDYSEVRALALDGNTLYVAGRFVTAGGNPASGFAAYALGGVAAQARMQVDPGTVSFGDVVTGMQADLLVTITNAADATGPLTGSVSLPAGSPFTIIDGGGAFTLQPGGARGVTVRFSPQAQGAAAATLTITHNAPNVASPTTVTLTGNGTARGGVIVMRNFDPAGPQQTIGAQTGGFVFGTNGYGDRAKATVFTPPPGKASGTDLLSEVRVWFSYQDPLPGEATYTLAIHNGTAATGPTGPPLFSQTYRIASVNADDDFTTPSDPTIHPIEPALPVTGSFFAVVDFGAYSSTRLAAIASGPEVNTRVPEVWEQLSDGSWINVSDSWKAGQAGWQMWIEAHMSTTTPVETGEAPGTLAFGGATPDPFRDATTLQYTLDKAGPVLLEVFDLTGRRVATLVDAVQGAGAHTAAFDARGLASGTYLCRLVAGNQQITRPVVVVR